MNPLRVIDSISGALKHLALAVPLAAALWLGASPAALAIPTDALIHYTFDPGSISGNTVTNTGSLGSAANGTLQNATSVTGQFGNGLSFTGSDSGVRTTGNVAIGNAFTFACWVSTTNGNSGWRRIIMNNYQQSGYLGTDGGGKYLTIVKNQFDHHTATAPDTSGAWHHLAMTWDGTVQSFYYDGVLVGPATNPTGPTTLNTLIGFGCNSGAYSECWNGKMDEAFVFGRALSLAEIGSLYTNAPNTAPAAPTGVAATPVSSGTVSVSWAADANATSRDVSVTNTVTSIEQVFTTAAATSYTVTGLTNGTLYNFKVLATNALGSSAYSSTVSATPVPSSAKDILTFLIPGAPDGVISGTNISVIVPFGTDVTNLVPTYSVSAFASADASFPSGTARNFTTPQTYTITAQNTTTQNYTVSVTVAPDETTLLWGLVGNGAWDLSSANWKGQSSGLTSLFYNGKNAIFDKTTGGTITIAAGVLPASTTVSATAGTYAFSGSLAGAGMLTKSNGGSLNLDAANSYTGGTLISGGTVSCSLQNSSPLGGAGNVNVTIQSGGTLAMNRNQITGNLTLNGGKVATGNGWSDDAWYGPVALSGISTIDVGGTDGSLLITGVVSGPGSLSKLGTSVRPTRLTGANTFTGAVSVQAGVVQATSLNRISGGTTTSNLGAPTTVANGTISLGAGGTGGTLSYDGPGETTDRVIKLAGTTGSATITQSGTGAGFPTTRGESGLLKFTSDVSSPGTAGVDNRKTLILSHGNSLATGTNPGSGEISGSIGDSVLGTAGQLATSVTKSSFSSWTLSGVNTYSGATKVQGGTLIFSRSLALGGGSLDITAGAKVQLDYIGTRQISALTFNAGSAQPNGTYGSSRSLATFTDDTRFAGLGTVTIGAITGATTTTLARTSGNEPSNGGEALTFTATVAGSSPTGNVQFYDGLTLIGTSALDGSFQATLTTSDLTAAVHVISALYVGSAGNASSSGSLTQTVVETRTLATTTSLALTSGVNPSALGASVTFTATVAGSTPAGSVQFYDGTTPLGTTALNGSGQANLTTSGLTVGWRAITARYLGSATHLPSRTATAFFQNVNPPAGNGKLKVFILAGQSNMVGKGQVELGRDPNNTATTNMVGGLGSLRNMLNRSPEKYGYLADPANPTAQGNPGFLKRSDVWVTYTGEPNAPGRSGILDANFGNMGNQGLIGPEYGFGLIAANQFADPVLLIKIAWGGKSLKVDFRPPSSVAAGGPYGGGTLGPYYTLMINRVHEVLNNLPAAYPGYNGAGYEIAGFGWHQGWNDIGQVTAEYEGNLVNLIKDIRTEFGVPNLPVAIAASGMASGAAGNVLTAQLNVGNPALHPEFTGTVTSVDTRPFDYGTLLGTSTEGVHWNWSGESYFNVGESMGQAMMSLIPTQSSAKNILTFEFPGLPATTISGTDIAVTLPYGTPVNALAPTFTLSPLATASPVSGTTRNFATAQTYTVTAEDLSTQDYTVTVSIAPSPFSAWASNPGQGLTVGVNDGPMDDPDGDGISNLMEFTLGGAPVISSQAVLPALTKPAGAWLFEYDRSDAALATTTQVVEYGSDLTGWTPVTIPATSAGIVEITPGSPSDRVKVTIPNQGSQTFVRLKVSL